MNVIIMCIKFCVHQSKPQRRCHSLKAVEKVAQIGGRHPRGKEECCQIEENCYMQQQTCRCHPEVDPGAKKVHEALAYMSTVLFVLGTMWIGGAVWLHNLHNLLPPVGWI